MPRSKRNTRKAIRSAGEYMSPAEKAPSISSMIATAQIPQFRSQVPIRKTFRFTLTSGVGLTTGWTTTMFLDLYAVAVGGSATPCRLYNNMKLLGVKLWQPATYESAGSISQTPLSSFLAIEFSPSTTAGFGGAPRVPYTASAPSVGHVAHLAVKPKRNELASQWFSAQQANYVLLNMQAAVGTTLQVDLLVTEVNGETPVTNAYTSSVAKGTIGVTNFGVTGCRSVGLENLVNP